MPLKPLHEQVAVVLGASSGIGRETARRLAARGARVVVAARGEPGLASLVDEITAAGGQAASAACDVAEFAQVEAVADLAARTFGRIDTWVNVAAVSVYARFEDTTLEEFRRVMDVNFLGQVHGAKAALPHLRREGRGALIAVSSVESVVSLPLHSAYAASKHAVEGVFDALRRELMAEGVPISVTSVKPGTINTPFFNNARNKMDVKPKGPPPIYQPGVVADCILYAAEHPVRDLWAGGAGKAMAFGQSTAPRLVDAALARGGIPAERTGDASGGFAPGTLDAPRADEHRAEGDFGDQARGFSLYTWMETHPRAGALAAAGALAGAALLAARRAGAGRDAGARHARDRHADAPLARVRY
jgi:NAD(P)-dependent dehydrogenase (short-subunit alcohol dehydrogenase family)